MKDRLFIESNEEEYERMMFQGTVIDDQLFPIAGSFVILQGTVGTKISDLEESEWLGDLPFDPMDFINIDYSCQASDAYNKVKTV